MAEIELSESEAIKLTITHNYDGEEFESAKFKKLGCLDGQRDKETGEFNNRAMVKFIRKLQSIYESVRVEGKGKNRKYILEGKRNVILPMEDKRKNNGTTIFDVIISRFFFNRLVQKNTDKPKSTYNWAVDIGAYNPKLIKFERVKQIFGEMYYGQDNHFIYNQFVDYIKNRNRAVAANSFKLLKRCGLINTIEHMMGLNEEDKVVNIYRYEYETYTSRKNEILKSRNLNNFNYEYHLLKNDLLKNDIDKLIEDTGYKRVWIAYEVTLLSTELFVDANYYSFQEAYWNKTAMLINDLKAEESKLYSFANVNKKFNLAKIIKSAGFDYEAIDSIIEKHKPTQDNIESTMNARNDKYFKMPDSWTIKQANKAIES
ncbi:hypothetical protein [Solibacillus sp. FSL K6-1523]|uniref:hypothetical protein n=1 Tax=Solibacillus sp. FSL K6-1523 TaxID=2921471 RepID=UPI0030F7CCCF